MCIGKSSEEHHGGIQTTDRRNDSAGGQRGIRPVIGAAPSDHLRAQTAALESTRNTSASAGRK